MRSWSRRRWGVALVGSVAVALAVGIPTDVIPNPVFGRPVAVTWWSVPVLIATAVLAGLLAATYVRERHSEITLDGPGRLGGVGGVLSFFAVGCPVCNKLVVIALGTTGAQQWFAPVQPVLAVASLIVLTAALVRRLRSERACAWSPGSEGVAASETAVDDDVLARHP